MASPETTRAAPKSPALQDSPSFTYMSNLSPLKPIVSRPSLQPYRDASCLIPQPVFASPRPSELSLLRRLSDAEKLSSEHGDRAVATFQEIMALVPSVMKMVYMQKCCNNDLSQDQTCNSPTICVDEFLLDHLENSDDPSSSPEQCLKQTVRSARADVDSVAVNQNEYQDEGVLQAEHALPITAGCASSTGLSDLSLDQGTALPQYLRSNSTSTEGSAPELLATVAEACTSTEVAVLSSSEYEVEKDQLVEGLSVLANTVETGSKMKMVKEYVKVNVALLEAQLQHGSEVDAKLHKAAEEVIDADSAISGQKHEHNSIDQDAQDHLSLILKDANAGCEKENYNNSSFSCQGTVHIAETVQLDEPECTPQLWSKLFYDTQAEDNHLDVAGAKSSASAKIHIPCNQEDDAQDQSGMCKHFQFETAESCRRSAEFQTNTSTFTSNVTNEESLVTSLAMESVISTKDEFVAASVEKQLLRSVSGNSFSNFPCNFDTSVRVNRSLPILVSKTLGTSLHLNSIGGSTNITESVHSENDLGEQVEKSGCKSQASQYPKKDITSRILISCDSVKSAKNLNVSLSATENNEEKLQENQVKQTPNSSCQATCSAKLLNSSVLLSPIDNYITPSMKRRASEDARRSPRKKQQMKKAPENKGCKQCTCKRSKCLKLYCECFAGRVLCSEACDCQGCYNKPEHEDTISEARQHIQCHNPLAFAPKVILSATKPLKDTKSSERVTPISARHKSGCNCRKSLCLKKYCECFQAGVGCSMGCRCDGCRNTFGRRDGGYDIIRANPQKLDSICCNSLSPATPLFQTTTENDVSRCQLPASFCSSPETEASVSLPLDESPGQVDLFSPGWNEFPDICKLSPLENPFLQKSGRAAAPRSSDPNTSLAFQVSSCLSVGSCQRSSPVTLLPRLGERKFSTEPDSHSRLYDSREQDDVPEVLKDTCSPIKAGNASSPNQKRVCPPHKSLHEMKSKSFSWCEERA